VEKGTITFISTVDDMTFPLIGFTITMKEGENDKGATNMTQDKEETVRNKEDKQQAHY